MYFFIYLLYKFFENDFFQPNQSFELAVSNLPVNCDPLKIRGRLKRLAENCGGRVGHVIGLTTTIRFPTLEFAMR